MIDRRVVMTFVFSVLLIPAVRAQRFQDLPSPDSSRAPFLTRARPDSIRLQVRSLIVIQLLENLQEVRSAAIDGDLAAVEWGPADQLARTYPGCGTVGAAVSSLAARLGSSARLKLFFANVNYADTTTIVRVVVGGATANVFEVLMTHDRETMRVKEMIGLISGLCSVLRQ